MRADIILELEFEVYSGIKKRAIPMRLYPMVRAMGDKLLMTLSPLGFVWVKETNPIMRQMRPVTPHLIEVGEVLTKLGALASGSFSDTGCWSNGVLFRFFLAIMASTGGWRTQNYRFYSGQKFRGDGTLEQIRAFGMPSLGSFLLGAIESPEWCHRKCKLNDHGGDVQS